MRRTTRWSAAALAAALGVPVVAGGAWAADDPSTGYWSRTRLGAPVPVSPPTPVPDGGSWVSGDPTGPVAVSAFRAGADDGSVVTGLRLPIADALGTPDVLVCPTNERWAPEQNGRLEVAPTADCTAGLGARVDGDVLVVELPAALQADVVDVLLAPAPGTAFSLTMERATAEAVVQAPAAGAPGDTAPLPPVSEPAPAPGFDSGSSGGASLPDLPAPVPAVEPVLPAPQLPPPVAAPVPQPQAAPPATPQLAVTPQAVVEPDRTGSLLAAAVLALLGMLAVRLAAQPAAAPRHLGGGARLSRPAEPVPAQAPSEPDRGVGRFRAPRLRPPVRI